VPAPIQRHSTEYHQTGKCIRPKNNNTCVSFYFYVEFPANFFWFPFSSVNYHVALFTPSPLHWPDIGPLHNLLQLHGTRTPVFVSLSYSSSRPLHSFSSYRNLSSRLSRSTVMAQPVYDQHPLQTYFTGSRPMQLPPQTSSSNPQFSLFYVTESERDVEIMPGGNFDDFDGLRPGKLPFASAVSWVLQVRRI